MTNKTAVGAAAAAGFLACIIGANLAITHYGMVPVGLGLLAPAGVYFAGATFILRDSVQDAFAGKGTSRWSRMRGRVVLLALILTGAALSAFLSPQLAVASGVAFLLSETVDLAIYSPLRDRGYVRAAAASNVAGAVVDSAVFLTLAGIPLAAALPGQVLGKTLLTLAVVGLVLLVRGARAMRATA